MKHRLKTKNERLPVCGGGARDQKQNTPSCIEKWTQHTRGKTGGAGTPALTGGGGDWICPRETQEVRKIFGRETPQPAPRAAVQARRKRDREADSGAHNSGNDLRNQNLRMSPKNRREDPRRKSFIG
jgi:hypothetical protein